MDALQEAQASKWVLIEVKNATNPNRDDGKFKTRKWNLRDQGKFGPDLIRVMQDLFTKTGNMDVSKLLQGTVKDLGGVQLEALKGVDWGGMYAKYSTFMFDVIANALQYDFPKYNDCTNWINDNIDIFDKKNAWPLVQDLFLLQFGQLKNVERLPEEN